MITPCARKAPPRTLDPPGTTRTPSSGINLRGRKVALSTKDNPSADPMDCVLPNRNPSKIPLFTHPFTRQPRGREASGSAARNVPASSASRNSKKASSASEFPIAAAPWATHCSIRSCNAPSTLTFHLFSSGCSFTGARWNLPGFSPARELRRHPKLSHHRLQPSPGSL